MAQFRSATHFSQQLSAPYAGVIWHSGITYMKQIEFKMWQLKDRPSIKEQIDLWLQLQGDCSSAWSSCDFEATGIKLLFRNETNDIDGKCLVIASIFLSDDMQRKGFLKSLLKYLVGKSPYEFIAFEDIDNPILLSFCKRNSFEPVSKMYPNSMLVHKSKLQSLSAVEFSY
ncbi:hypothetical protein L2737_17260 [Shewanella electrodiphila]|uniref:N-acetyltransferase domain-containing protein n=1 Tax=Shewanella electrodiphila TaxID=934143 RepID=A0ABT0KTQ3_9GAMM|nr:hypothetical protein [Shewanella electrodiphila]MCL1047049.1 hypothetical protein [Shewanella electrodiphila]